MRILRENLRIIWENNENSLNCWRIAFKERLLSLLKDKKLIDNKSK